MRWSFAFVLPLTWLAYLLYWLLAWPFELWRALRGKPSWIHSDAWREIQS